MIFRQFFDQSSCTYTYLIADREQSKEAILIDPVESKVDEYLELLDNLGLQLTYSFETHVHADHISASGLLRQATGAKTGIGVHCGAETADFQLEGEEVFRIGDAEVRCIATPGHTPGSMSFLWQDKVFTGDALFIGGCGRTDFQNGNPADLYDSVTTKLFTLPGETLVYPGHDYNGKFVSCIAQEKTGNPRLAGKTKEEFIDIMDNLNLPMPKLIDKAVPANLYCGLEAEQALQMAESNEYQSPDKDRRGYRGAINQAKQQVEQLNVSEAKSMLGSNENCILLDVREQNEYDRGHIDHSIHLPRGKVKNDVESVLSDVPKETPIIIYCASGNRSALAGKVMRELGYGQVYSMIGGYVAWKRDS